MKVVEDQSKRGPFLIEESILLISSALDVAPSHPRRARYGLFSIFDVFFAPDFENGLLHGFN